MLDTRQTLATDSGVLRNEGAAPPPARDQAESALDLARRGLRVFPLAYALPSMREPGKFICSCGRLLCSSAAKHPMTPRGCHDASTDESRVRGWWLNTPNANIGIATGEIIVLDIDGDTGANSIRKIVDKHGPLPKTWRARTGGGWHIFFRPPKGVEISNSASAIAPGVDVRGANGYIVGPPSRHISGRRYQWAIGPDDAPLAEWPAYLSATSAARNARSPDDWLAIASQPIANGQRNDTLARIAGLLLGANRPGVDILTLSLCLGINARQCQPPLPDDEVKAIVESIGRKELRRRAGDEHR